MVILNCYKEQSSATSHTPTTEGPGWKLTKPNVIKKFLEAPILILCFKSHSLQCSHLYKAVEIKHSIEERVGLWNKLDTVSSLSSSPLLVIKLWEHVTKIRHQSFICKIQITLPIFLCWHKESTQWMATDSLLH